MHAQAQRSVFLLICMSFLLQCGRCVAQSPSPETVDQQKIVPDAPPTPTLRPGTLVIANQTPYTVIAAVYIETDPHTHRTDGWYTLGPGEIKTLRYEFDGAPNYRIYAETRSPEAVRLIHKRAKGRMSPVLYFDGTGDIASAHLISYSGVEFVETAASLLNPPSETKAVSFAQVPTDPAEEQSVYRVVDSLLPGVNDTSGLSVTPLQERNIIAARARSLARSLERQQQVKVQFPRPQDVPYQLGILLKDPNGRAELGVVIVATLAKTIFGDPMLFQRGDILTGLSGASGEIEPVYAYEDIVSLLNEHATNINKGIAVPIKFRLTRGSEEIIGQTTYRFNLACTHCWPVGELTDFKAFASAAINAWTLGGGAWVTAVLSKIYYLLTTGYLGDDVALEHFLQLQKDARLRQYAPRLSKLGEFIPLYGLIFTSAPRLILNRLLARTFLFNGSTALLTNIALDTAESSAWLVFSGSPLISKDYLRAEAKRSIPANIKMSVGMHAVFGVLGHSTPISIPHGRGVHNE